MRFFTYGFAAVVALLAAAGSSHGRVWTDSSGHYSIDADLIAFNDGTVVLQRADHELVAVPIAKLSAADQEYLRSTEASEAVAKLASDMQTWTLTDGTKIVGKVVDYAKRDLTLQRRRGHIYVNDRRLENLPEIYQRMVPKIVAHYENLQRDDLNSLTAWLVRQRGQPRTFLVEGVVIELENGDEYGVPFFFFSPEDLKILKPGWDEWLAAHDDYSARDEHTFLLQSLAAARHRDAEVQNEIARMNLNLQAVQAGLTAVWEVTLYPVAGNNSPPIWVVAFGRNSAQATEAALAEHPGFVAGPVRRVSNRF